MKITDQINLRAATNSDSDLIYAIKKAAFLVYVERQYGDWNEVEQRNYHLDRFVPQDFRLVVVDGHVAGFLAVVKDSVCIKVNQLMIRPEHQSKGIGEHCMALIASEAKSSGLPIHLQVMKVNPRALDFYKHIKFVVVRETETHYQMMLAP